MEQVFILYILQSYLERFITNDDTRIWVTPPINSGKWRLISPTKHVSNTPGADWHPDKGHNPNHTILYIYLSFIRILYSFSHIHGAVENGLSLLRMSFLSKKGQWISMNFTSNHDEMGGEWRGESGYVFMYSPHHTPHKRGEISRTLTTFAPFFLGWNEPLGEKNSVGKSPFGVTQPGTAWLMLLVEKLLQVPYSMMLVTEKKPYTGS